VPSSDLANQHGRQGDGTPSDGDADEVLEGGFVPALQDYFVEQKHRADTARRLAYALVCLLGGTVFIHYVGVLILVLNGRGDAVESLSRIFNVWLPVISSLVGAAVTYYFTREK
jgi:hypothetical protein